MKYFSIACLSAAMCLGAIGKAAAQGESDPGMGSIGAMRPASAVLIDEDVYENNKPHLGFSHVFAKGERDVIINMPQAELRVPVMDFGYIDVKLPVYSVKGDIATVWGLGDLYTSYTHMFIMNDVMFQATGGLQIGTGTAALADGKSRPLPMVYQSTKGTTDLILGASVQWKQYLTAAVGYQQPFIQYNQNQYTGHYVTNEAVYSNQDFSNTRNYYRRGDVMLRLEGRYSGKRAGISAGPVAFYHLSNDLYEDVNNKTREIADSKGLTVNIGGNAFYRMGRRANWKIDLSAGMPVVERDVRPDGLRREWYIMPRITYFFNQENILFN